MEREHTNNGLDVKRFDQVKVAKVQSFETNLEAIGEEFCQMTKMKELHDLMMTRMSTHQNLDNKL